LEFRRVLFRSVPPRLPRGRYLVLAQRQRVAAWRAELRRIEAEAQAAKRTQLGAPEYIERRVPEDAEFEARLRQRLGLKPEVDAWRCPECGDRQQLPAGCYGLSRLRPCECIASAGRAALLAYKDAYRMDAAAELWQTVDVPERYRGCTLDNFERRKGASKALRACRDWLQRSDDSYGLVLVGPVGCGKTHLAVATARASIEADLHTVEFVSANELVERHRASGFDRAVLEDFAQTALLILDDLGQTRATDYTRDTIYTLLDTRYTAQRPTIISTNLDGSKLATLYGDALVSRLYDAAVWTALTATDYRAERARGRA